MKKTTPYAKAVGDDPVMRKLVYRSLRAPRLLKIALLPRSDEQARRVGTRLAHVGLQRLSDVDVERRATLLLASLEHIDYRCGAGLLRGPTSSKGLAHTISALHALPSHLVDEWFEIAMQAVATVVNDLPEVELPEQPLPPAMQLAFNDLDAGDLHNHLAALRAPLAATDRLLCEAAQALYSRALKIPGPGRVLALRLLMQPDRIIPAAGHHH